MHIHGKKPLGQKMGQIVFLIQVVSYTERISLICHKTLNTILTLSVPVCHLCGKSFKTSTGLRRLTRNIHGTPNNKCKVCNELYTSKTNLREHENKLIGVSIHIKIFQFILPLRAIDVHVK